MPPPLEQEEHCMPPWGFAPSLDLAAASAEEPAQAGHHYSLSYNTCSPPADQPEGADFFDQLGPDPDSQVEEALDNVTSTPPRLSSEEAREQPEPAAPHTPHDSSSPPISPTLSLSLQPQYIPAAPQQSFFDQAEEERVELSFPSPAGDDDVDSSGGLFLPGQPQYPEDTLLAASPGLNGPSHVALGQGEQEEEEEGLALSAALGGWGHPAPAHTAPPVPLLPHLAAGAAGADADGGDGFISPRDADDEASRHLVSTADFIRQLLATISEGGSVHPATMLEARNLVSLIQDPRFITLVRGDAAESSPSTPGRSVYSTSLLMSVTPAKEAYAQHLMHGNPSPNTQATSSSSPADVGGDGTSSQQAMSFDTPSKPLRKSADGGVMAACTPFWPSPHPGQSADDYNFALDMSAQISSLRRELQQEFESKLELKTAELEVRFEARLGTLRAEVASEYETKLSAMAAETDFYRAKCHDLQTDLDELLLCLGQESTKVTSLADALRNCGLDPEEFTAQIEAEYAAMELPASEA